MGDRPLHILLLEDDRSHQELALRAFLGESARFRISLAPHLARAREILLSDPPDLILADWILPDGKGIEILPRDASGQVMIPLVIMTGFGDEQLAVEIMKSGAMDYIVKSPMVFRDLPRISQRALREWENIMQRKRAEEAERDSEKRLADIIAFLPDAVLAIDTQGVVIAWNSALESLTGVSASEMLGKGDHAYSLPFYGERRPILVDLVLMGDAEIETRYDYVRREGDRITSETFIPGMHAGKGAFLWGTASPLRDISGRVIGAIEVIRDITERKRAEEDLRESAERFRIVFDRSSAGKSLTSAPDGRLLRVNQAFADMLGYSLEELQQLNFASITHPDDMKESRECMRCLVTGEKDRYRMEKRYIQKSGRVIWGDVTTSLFRDTAGKPLYLITTIFDITDRKQAEEALRESEQKYRFLVNNVRDIIWQATPDLIFTYLSPAAEALTGWTAAELTGTSLFGLLTESSVESVRERLRTRLEEYRSGTRVNATVFEIAVRNRNGEMRQFEVSSDPVYAPDGTFSGFHGITRDITERKHAEDALRESEQHLMSVYNTVGDVIFQLAVEPDETYRFTSINAAFSRVTGLSPAQVIGKTIREVIPEPSLSLVMEKYRQAIREKAIIRWEETSSYPGGTVTGDVSIAPVFDGEGTCTHLVGTVHDITERKRMEVELRESEEKFRSLVNNTGIGVGYWGMDGTLLYVNEISLKRLMRKPEELIGKNLQELFGPAAELYQQRMTYAAQSEKSLEFEDFVHLPSGDRWFLSIYSRIIGPDGEIRGIQVLSIDITARKTAQQKQEEYAARLEAAMEIGSLAWWEMDLPDGNVRFDDRKATLLGYSPQQFRRYSDFTALLHPDDYEPAMQAMRDHLEGRQARYYADYRIRDTSGNYRWFRDMGGITRRKDDGSPGTVTGIVIDITAAKEAEDEIGRASRYNRILIETSLDPMVTIGPDGRITDVNASTELVTGYHRDKLIGTDFSEYFTDPEKAREGYLRAFAEGAVRDFPLEIRHQDGHVTPVLYNTSAFRDETGAVIGIFAAARDITERKKAEAALRESEERYRMLVEEMPDFVIVHQDGELLYVNAAITRMLGKTAENLLHTSILDYVAPESRGTVLTAMEKREKGGSLAPYVARLLLPGGSTRWVEIRGASIMFEGRAASFNVLTDITDRKWAEQALFESEKKFRTVADFTYDWEYWTGPDDEYIYVSPSCERISGYAPDEFYQDKNLIRQIVFPDDTGILEEHKGSLSAIPDPQILEFRIRRRDGALIWIGHMCQPIFSPEGQYLGRRGSNRDITERKLATEALQKSEIRFRSLIQNSSDIIRILDRDRRIIYESPSSERILGYPADFLIGKDPRDFIHPDDRGAVQTDFREVLNRTNAGNPTEFRILKADGTYLWVDAVGTNLLGVPGIDGVVVTIRPVEQRKQMENVLRENQIRLAEAMDMASLVNWEFDVKSGIFTFNDRFYALYGTTAEAEGGYLMPAETYVREFVHPDDAADATTAIGNVDSITDPDFSKELEHRIIRRDGEMRYIVVRFGVIMDADGKVVRTRGANQDITNQKMMESEIRSLNRSLEQRVVQRTEELNKSLQDKELLLREIHHRVKNNLQIIISILRLQKRHITDAGTLSALMDSESRVRSMALVHEKLYRSKDLEHIDVGDYLKALAQYLFTTYAVEQRRISFTVVITGLSLDIQRAIPIGLILNELIANALKHAFADGRKGEIRITGQKEDDRILIFIEDNGVGFPEGLDWRHTQSLGMHLVMTLIEQVRGTIELKTGNEGTKFTITIPDRGGK